jgi:ABC-type transport system involved in multi-copper enzyme maturation permease subunit
MRQLLWKEMRDLRPWLLVGSAICGALYTFCLSESFAQIFLSLYWDVLLFLLAAVVAIGLAAGRLAGERHARTLDYLLVRPVAERTIMLAKFIAGTATLFVLLCALVALGYSNFSFRISQIEMMRRRATFSGMLTALFPRFWCLYALTFSLSAFTDRTMKAATAAVAFVITISGGVLAFMDIAPFAGFEVWLPFIELTGGFVRVASDISLLARTGITYCLVAVMIASGAAVLFGRMTDRIAGNRVLVLGGVGLISVAIAAARLSWEGLPALQPVAGLEFKREDHNSITDLAASNGLVCLGLEHTLTFMEFSDTVRPRKLARVEIPLWTTHRITLAGRTAYVVGVRKALPADEVQVLSARLNKDESVEISTLLSLGKSDGNLKLINSGPLVEGRFLYIGSFSERQSQIHVVNLASPGKSEANLIVDTIREDRIDESERGFFTMCLRGSYIYIASPSALTTLNVSEPAKPVITSRIPFDEPVRELYGYQRFLVCQGNRLYETNFWPQYLRSYDLSDPGRPARAAELAYHWTQNFSNATTWSYPVTSGTAMYQPWRDGLIEFRPEHKQLLATRYLNDGRVPWVRNLVADGNYVYSAESYYDTDMRRVNAYRVR